VPAFSVFEIKEGLRAATRGLTHRAEQASGPNVHEAISAAAGSSARTVRGKPHHGTARRAAGHGSRNAGHRRGGAPKHLAQARKRNA
jgi:hypothetical protein